VLSHGRRWICLLIGCVVASMWVASVAVRPTVADARSVLSTPIKHVVIIDQENHSFDNVLGKLCVDDGRCDGATTATTTTGPQPLSEATDAVPQIGHTVADQRKAIDRGAMDGWLAVHGCEHGACLTQYYPDQIPSVAALARAGVIADRYFSPNNAPSFGSHLFFTNQTLDGFTGDNPSYVDTSVARGPGWGCDSNLEAMWNGSWVPSCVPLANGSGAFKATPVPHTDTIMDALDRAHRSWKIYASKPGTKRDGSIEYLSGYEWNPCAYNADCLYSAQVRNLATPDQVVSDASNGRLPNFSLVVPNGPTGQTSQHNGTSMILGDNWIGSIVSAIQNGPDAASTTIFITWDDCGCFYDHVPPPAGYGIRLPLVIVSPYAKPGYTDSGFSTSSSILAYAEHVLGVASVERSTADATAYDFSNSFDYSQAPRLRTFTFTPGRESPQTKAYLLAHPADPRDAT
jgi:phospholipase C